MGYFFVDRILEIQHGGPSGQSSGRGLKSIGQMNPFLRPPIALSRSDSSPELELSPCFAGEAVGQLAAWVAMSHLGFSLRPVAGLTAEDYATDSELAAGLSDSATRGHTHDAEAITSGIFNEDRLPSEVTLDSELADSLAGKAASEHNHLGVRLEHV